MLALDVCLHAFEPGGVAAFAAESVAVGDLNLVVLAVQDGGAGLGGQVLEGGVQVEAELLPQACEQAQPVFGGCFALRPGSDSALAEGQVGIGYEQFGVYFKARADAVAGATCAERRVEGEGARLDGVDLQRVIIGAGEVFAEGAGAFGVVLLAVHEVDEYAAVSQLERGFDGVGQALVNTVLNDDAVDDHLDGVLVLLGELGRVGELHGFAVHTGTRIALGQQVLEEVYELALTCTDDGREDLQAGAFGVFLQNVHDLLRGLLGDFLATFGAVRVADARPEQTHVVVDFGDGTDGRTRVLGGGFLVDGNRRGEALDEVDVGLVDLAQEHAGVGGERLDVAALTLGEDGVEGEGGLTGAGEAGEDDHRITRNGEVYVLEVVFAGTLNPDTGQVVRFECGATVCRAGCHRKSFRLIFEFKFYTLTPFTSGIMRPVKA